MKAPLFDLRQGNAFDLLNQIPDQSVQCCVTSPPYWGLRDYGVTGQIGLERTPDEYADKIVSVLAEARRVLKDDGTLWLNLGDSYASGGKGGGGSFMAERREAAWQKKSTLNGWRSKPPRLKDKDLVGVPWMVAFALRADGWYLRSDIIWHKPNPMPESVTDRPTKSHEYLFLMAKSERYYYDSEAIKEDGSLQRSGNTQHKYVNGQHLNRTKSGFLKMRGRVYERVNKRTVWSITTSPTTDAHFATFPMDLPETCILAGSREGDTVLDPFSGAGTTGLACLKRGRAYIGLELNPKYIEISMERARRRYPLLLEARDEF